MWSFCCVGIPQAYWFVQCIVFDCYVMDILYSSISQLIYTFVLLPFGQCPQICWLAGESGCRCWKTLNFVSIWTLWCGKGKPVWRPFCVQSLKNIDLINILCAIPHSYTKWMIRKVAVHRSMAWRPVHSTAHIFYLQNTQTQHNTTHPECEEAWICSYGPFVHDSFQFTFRFIWTHVRRLLFTHSCFSNSHNLLIQSKLSTRFIIISHFATEQKRENIKKNERGTNEKK